MRTRIPAILLAALLGAAPAAAGELVLGLGADSIRGLFSDDRQDNLAASGLVEYRTGSFTALGRVAFAGGVATEFDTDGDLWGGGGPVAFLPLGDGPWRLAASGMVGGYSRGSGNDLGTSFPIFRSQLELSRALDGDWRAGLAWSHKSNAGTGRINPGVETIYLFAIRTF